MRLTLCWTRGGLVRGDGLLRLRRLGSRATRGSSGDSVRWSAALSFPFDQKDKGVWREARAD